MFKALRRLLWGMFLTDMGRAIFHYWDGSGERRADPLVLWQALQNDPEFVFEKHLPGADRGEVESLLVCQNAVQRAFSVPTFESGGLTQLESLELLQSYLEYLDALKKNGVTLPISPQPTA